MANVTRRSFFFGVTSAGLVALADGPVAANAKRPRPNLRIGLASDIHINQWRATTERYKAVLKYFDSAKVDGVLIAGDLADSGVVGELKKCGAIWNGVRPRPRKHNRDMRKLKNVLKKSRLKK